MAKLDRALIQLVSENDVKSILKIDAPKLSSSSSFIQENLLSAYVLINTWLMIIKQVSEFGWKYVLTHLRSVGLIQTIREFDSAADELVHGTDVTFSLARTIMVDVNRSVPVIGIPINSERNVNLDPVATALAIFRFPKRFSPIGADKLRDSSIQGFLDTQKRLKLEQRHSHSMFVVERVRDCITRLIDWDKLCNELDSVDISDIVFTPGVSFDTNSSLVSKLRSIAKEHVEYFYQPFGIPVVANRGVDEPRYDKNGVEIHTVRLVVVPKNYKTGRVIAPENVYRQALARRYFEISDRYLPSMIKLHDQTQNQRYAQVASETGDLATLDLHAASDSLTPTLLVEVLPHRFVGILQRILPNQFQFVTDTKKGVQTRILHSAATMGNSMTFWLESVIFLGITMAAVEFYNNMANQFYPIVRTEFDETISVYGDDIICPTEAAITVMEWLEELGFIVNREKSFFTRDNLYRESCGEEYLEGINVSSIYFPRFPLAGSLGSHLSDKFVRDGFTGTIVDSMTALIDLQHKMHFVCIPASLLIGDIVCEANRRMTYSTPEEGKQDLYSYENLPVILPAPCGKVVDGKVVKVETDQIREAHLGPITTWSSPQSEQQKDEELVRLYNYAQFLKFGPRYPDALSKLLGISDPPVSYEEASGVPIVKWALIK